MTENKERGRIIGAVWSEATIIKPKASTQAGLRFLVDFEKLFLGSNCVFYGFGHAELHYGLGFDLDGFAGLRVASHASFAVGLYQAAQAGNHGDAVFLGFFDSA